MRCLEPNTTWTNSNRSDCSPHFYSLAIIVPSLAVTVRRLHDVGRSGWWILISLIPLIGGIVIFVFMVLDSHEGENRFGPNPKEVAVG